MENESTRTAMKIAGLEIERDSLQRCVTELESTIAAQAAVIEAFKNWAADALYNDKPKRWTWLVDILHDAEALSQAPQDKEGGE
jgi:uncharacterized coiled-coil protein SlyX